MSFLFIAFFDDTNSLGMASEGIDPSVGIADANREQSNVDRSAERASSAVEVGATNSPDGANQAEEGHLTGRGTRERGGHGANRQNGGLADDVRPAEQSGNSSLWPSGKADGAISVSRDSLAAATEYAGTAGGSLVQIQHRDAPTTSNSSTISSRKTKSPAPNSSPASGTILKPLSKADQIRLLRPNCRHADDLEKCAGNGKTHCRDCKVAAAESEVA